jgi:Zn-finger nucleic acid-binding protein
MSERSGVEIDYCPQCRGVWLDRGELDKILERSDGGEQPYRYDPRDHQPPPSYGYKQKKRKGWLGEMLDFD